MSKQREITTLSQLLDTLCQADADADEDEDDRIRVATLWRRVGRRSFGPLLLIPGLIALSPLSGLPGAPTTIGVMVLLVAGQFLIGRTEFWLPDFILRRSISRQRFKNVIRILRPVARFVDRLIKPRLTFLTNGAFVYLIAGFCLLLALTAPLLEVVPFAITGVGAAVVAFGLALISDDGALVILALLACLATAAAGIVVML